MIPVVVGSNPIGHPRLLRRASAVPGKAARIEFARNTTVEDAFRTIVGASLAQIRTNAPGVVVSTNPEFVHQMRVGMRRLRSAFVAFRAAIPGAASARIRSSFREASLALGVARDWEILCLKLAAAPMRALGRPSELRRGAALRGARRVVAARKFEGALLRAERWLANAEWRSEASGKVLGAQVATLAPRALKRLLGKALKCGESAAALGNEGRHRLRVRVKRLRYACEFFAPLYSRRRTHSFIKSLQYLQDTLGELNDIAVARRLLGNVAGVHAINQRRERRLLSEFCAQWKALKQSDPFW